MIKKISKGKIRCPDCKGTGKTRRYTSWIGGGGITVDCNRCYGAGEIKKPTKSAKGFAEYWRKCRAPHYVLTHNPKAIERIARNAFRAGRN